MLDEHSHVIVSKNHLMGSCEMKHCFLDCLEKKYYYLVGSFPECVPPLSFPLIDPWACPVPAEQQGDCVG